MLTTSGLRSCLYRARHRVAGRVPVYAGTLRAEALHEHGANRSVPVDFDAVRLGNAGMQPQVANGGLSVPLP